MKARILVIMVIVAMLFAAFGIDSARAGAYDTQFTTSITYFNVGTAATTTLRLYFYASEDDTIPTTHDLAALPVHGAGSINIGSIDLGAEFSQGSAYLESDQMMHVTLVQVPDNLQVVVKNRGMSNGFITGGPKALLPTVLRNKFDTHSVFSVQNADTVANIVTIDFNPIEGNDYSETVTIQPGAAYYVDAGLKAELGAIFNGSAVITATLEDTVTPGNIVASSMEYYIAGIGVYAWEGFAAGVNKMYMPAAMCLYGGNQTSYYAVQNTGAVETLIKVTYTPKGGVPVEFTTPTPILPGAKYSFNACTAGMPVGTLGAAEVEGLSAPIVAIGKVNIVNSGFTTAFNGVDAGSLQMSLPYVRWGLQANYDGGIDQRTFISIQNVGQLIPEGNTILIKYWNHDGVLAGTHTYAVPAGGLATGAKFNSNASMCDIPLAEFGIYYTPAKKYGGAVTVEVASPYLLTAIGRTQSWNTYDGKLVAEDANSQPLR